MTGLKGIAGEDIEVGQIVYRGNDGKFYLANGAVQYVGAAKERIKAGQEFTDDNFNGLFRPVNNPKK